MITTRGLTKTYGGKVALSSVDLHVPEGSVFGLVGPNGAGKSTLLSVLTGLRRASAGDVEISTTPHERSLLPDTPRFEPWLTGREVVELALQLTRGDIDADRVTEVLDQAGLADAAHRKVGGYSRGMLQRLGMATAVVAKPRLLLLDEPASALDPQGRREVLDLIGAMRGTATVLFSSHILGDVQSVCDRVAILREGSLLFQGRLDELLAGDGRGLRIEVSERADELVTALEGEEWVQRVERVGERTVQVSPHSTEEARSRIARVLADVGCGVVALESGEATLEDVFMELTR